MSGRVTGIGGVFFRSKDPAALATWYKEHLGISQVPQTLEDVPWMQEAGPTVFAPYELDSPNLGRDSQQFMLNFRVDGLDALLERLAASGIQSDKHQTMDGVGRFAWIYDPEGNPIELWEPEAPEQA